MVKKVIFAIKRLSGGGIGFDPMNDNDIDGYPEPTPSLLSEAAQVLAAGGNEIQGYVTKGWSWTQNEPEYPNVNFIVTIYSYEEVIATLRAIEMAH